MSSSYMRTETKPPRKSASPPYAGGAAAGPVPRMTLLSLRATGAPTDISDRLRELADTQRLQPPPAPVLIAPRAAAASVGSARTLTAPPASAQHAYADPQTPPRSSSATQRTGSPAPVVVDLSPVARTASPPASRLNLRQHPYFCASDDQGGDSSSVAQLVSTPRTLGGGSVGGGSVGGPAHSSSRRTSPRGRREARVGYRNGVTGRLLDLYDEVHEIFLSRRNMQTQVREAMLSDPRYATGRRGDEGRVAAHPTAEQEAALSEMTLAIETLDAACVELVAAFLTPEEKRYLGLDTHLFQTRRERRTSYQYMRGPPPPSRAAGERHRPAKKGKAPPSTASSASSASAPSSAAPAASASASSRASSRNSAPPPATATPSAFSAAAAVATAAAAADSDRGTVPSARVSTRASTPPTELAGAVSASSSRRSEAQAEAAAAPPAPQPDTETTPERAFHPNASRSSLGDGEMPSQSSPPTAVPSAPAASADAPPSTSLVSPDVSPVAPPRPAISKGPVASIPIKAPPSFLFAKKAAPTAASAAAAPAPSPAPAPMTAFAAPPATATAAAAGTEDTTAASTTRRSSRPLVRAELQQFLIDSDSDSSAT